MRAVYPLLLLFFPLLSNSQCPITVDAGPDQFSCFPPTPATFSGSVGGDYLNFMWTPTTGMSGANTLTPTVNVGTTTNYVLKASAIDYGNNLVVNGDFELGNTGFTSDYDYNPGFSGPPFGSYEIATNPTFAFWAQCPDHTSGSGNYMIIDGSDVPNELLWCQSIPVTPNTGYVFSTWVTSTNGASPLANLEFTVNGSVIGTITAPSQTCNWIEFTATWNSGNNTTANICIEDIVVTGSNNDFAIDDVGFFPVCTLTDTVTVHVIDINAVAAPVVGIIPCAGANLTLNGAGSSTGPAISYLWESFDGNIVSGENTLTPVVNQPGAYTLSVSYDYGSGYCTESASVNVIESPNPLFAWTNNPQPLGCGGTSVALNGFSNQGAVVYSWSTTNGNILSGENNNTAMVNQPGEYQLLVTNSITGCTATALVDVTTANNPPTALASAAGAISCAQQQVTLSGTGSSAGPGIAYLWSTTNGNILSGQDSLQALAGAGGTYILSVINTANNCTTFDTVSVQADTLAPNIQLQPTGVLSCVLDTLWLNVGLNPTGSTAAWNAGAGGVIVAGNDSTSAAVTAAGIFTIVATNPANGCTASAQDTVLADYTAPVVQLQPADTLSCQQTSVLLDGSGSSTGAGFMYFWSGPGIQSGADSLVVQVNASGIYTLSISNTANGCTAAASLVVPSDSSAVTAIALAPDTLNCSTTTLVLSSTGSSSAPGISYLWSTSDGQIDGPAGAPSVQISKAGNYTLLVTNSNNGCSASDAVDVLLDTLAPNPVIAAPGIFTCTTQTQSLQVSGGNYNYVWSTSGGGAILSGQNTDAPLIGSPGTYTLLATNPGNGCTSSQSVTVSADANAPQAQAVVAGVLNCLVSGLNLDATGSSAGTGIQYLWTAGNGGNIVSGANSTSPFVDAPGDYQLLVTDTLNGCTATASVSVTENIQLPAIGVLPPDSLTCTVTTGAVSVDAPDPSYVYFWQTSGGGLLLSGQNTATATVGAAGVYTVFATNPANGCSSSASVNVYTDGNTPIAVIAAPDTLTCIATQVQLQGSGSTGTGYSYAWTGGNIVSGNNTPTPLVNAPGAYILLVTDTGNGCTAQATATVVQNLAAPAVSIAVPDVLTCKFPGAFLNGFPSGPGYNYQWTGNLQGNTSGSSVFVDAPGVYTLLVSDQTSGCTGFASTTVTANNTPPVAGIASPGLLSCLQTSLSLSASVIPSTGNLLLWTTQNGHFTGGTSTLSPTLDAPGDYLLIVENIQNGCKDTVSTTVNQNITTPQVDAGPQAVLNCGSQQAVLDGSGSAAGVSFNWTGPNILSGANSSMPQVGASGQYQLIVTDPGNGCTATDNVLVTTDTLIPAAVADTALPITCLQPTTLLNATGSDQGPGFSFLWSTLNGQFSGGTNTLTPTVSAAGAYNLVVTNTVNGCTAGVSIIVQENIALPTTDAGAPGLLTCKATLVELQGSAVPAGVQYNWSATGTGHVVSGASAAHPSVDAPGWYHLTVTRSDNGCTATDSTLVELAPAPAFELSVDQPDCIHPEGIAVVTVLNGDGPFVYSFDGGAGFQSLPEADQLATGVYSVVIRDKYGCTAGETLTIDPVQQPELYLPSVLTVPLGDGVLITPVTNPPVTEIEEWDWSPAFEMTCPDCYQTIITPTRSRVYQLTVTDNQGCTASAELKIIVDRTRYVYAPNVFSPDADGVNDFFTLFGRKISELEQLQIFDRWGNLVWQDTQLQAGVEHKGWDGKHRGRDVQPGVYAWHAIVVFDDGEKQEMSGDVTVVR